MGRASWTALGPLAAALALTMAGCSSSPFAAASPANDPLVGGGPALPPPGAAASTANPRPPDAAPTSPGGVPPLPSPNPPGSTAALASGAGVRTLDPGRDLRIGSGTGAAPSGSAAPVALMQPQPVGGSSPGAAAPPPPTTPAPIIPASGQRMVSPFEDARAQLLARGVVWMRLDTSIESGESKFVCSIPNKQNPSLRRTYEAVAKDDLAAIRAVLEKIDKEP